MENEQVSQKYVVIIKFYGLTTYYYLAWHEYKLCEKANKTKNIHLLQIEKLVTWQLSYIKTKGVSSKNVHTLYESGPLADSEMEIYLCESLRDLS